jgi:Ca-activated chloride channel family protein
MFRSKRKSTAVWMLIFAALLSIRPGAASAAVSLSAMQTGSLLLRMEQGYVTATLINTDVNITVNGLAARVSVMQEFKNEGSEWVEGTYVFPLPDKAAVDHMRLYIGDRYIEGEVQEKELARKAYEQAKQAGKKTSLVEQQRANLFTTSVANIAPGETVIVEIEYMEDVLFDNGVFSLRYPMTLTPRYIPGKPLPDKVGSGWSPDTDEASDASLITPPMVSASRAHKVSLQASINAGMPLEIIASRYHPVNVAETNGHYAVSLAGNRVPMDHDFELLWRPVPSSSPRAMAFVEMLQGEPHYLLMVMPPDVGEATVVRMPREMIFIIDTSGSMHGVSIAQAKRALQRALDRLQPEDRFNVIEFNSQANPLFATSVAADTAALRSAKDFVSQLQANGGTNMQPALQHALRSAASESHLKQIIFITDGSVGNEEGLFGLIETGLGNARLFTVGIGSAPNSWFMRKAAEAGRGSFTTISSLHEVGEKMDHLFHKLEQPQVTNIVVQWPSSVLIDPYPAVVPDLYLGEPVTIKVKASGTLRPGDSVRIAGDSTGGAWTRDLEMNISEDSPGIAALWARARIANLLDLERRGADAQETRKTIVDTALKHHLVSKYTSLVAIDKTPVRELADPLKTEQVANLMPYGQSGSAIFGFPATATAAPTMRHTGLALLIAALLLLAAPALHRKSRHGLAY